MRGAAMALLLGLGLAAPAEARGLVADENFPVTLISPGSTCDLGSACATPISFGGTNIYVYTDGAVTFGDPAPSSAVVTNLSSLGNDYIAPGLADYSGLDLGVWDFTGTPNDLQLWWIFNVPDAPGGKQAIFGIDLFHNPDGSFTAKVGSGALSFSWFGSDPSSFDQPTVQDTFKPYCDATCESAESSLDPGTAVYGVYLPDGALIGSSFSGTDDEDPADAVTGPWSVTVDNTKYTYPNYILNFSLGSTTAAPEPATLTMMGFSLGVMGIMLRRSRRRRAPARAE